MAAMMLDLIIMAATSPAKPAAETQDAAVLPSVGSVLSLTAGIPGPRIAWGVYE
jgi:hypothetical protein